MASHKGIPKVQAHHNIDKKQAEINRIKVRDYRVMSANVKTAGLAKKNKVRIYPDVPETMSLNLRDSSGDLVEYNNLAEELKEQHPTVAEANMA